MLRKLYVALHKTSSLVTYIVTVNERITSIERDDCLFDAVRCARCMQQIESLAVAQFVLCCVRIGNIVESFTEVTVAFVDK